MIVQIRIARSWAAAITVRVDVEVLEASVGAGRRTLGGRFQEGGRSESLREGLEVGAAEVGHLHAPGGAVSLHPARGNAGEGRKDGEEEQKERARRSERHGAVALVSLTKGRFAETLLDSLGLNRGHLARTMR